MAERLVVHYFAAARSAAGVDSEEAEAATLPALLAELVRRHGAPLERVLARCSYLVDGVAARPGVDLTGAARLDVLPPFAGG